MRVINMFIQHWMLLVYYLCARIFLCEPRPQYLGRTTTQLAEDSQSKMAGKQLPIVLSVILCWTLIAKISAQRGKSE